jgi:threonylcarbamoyladenosine tRNA methylthiotransferase MtaB
MNRRYTAEEFEKIVQKLRKAYSDVILTTDVIVGFAGETEEEFETTYNFLKKIKFYKTHIFKYSERKGTKAAEMENQVSPEKKEERSKKLIKLSEENEKEYLNSYIGKIVDVLFEETENKENLEDVSNIENEENSEKFYKGHTSNYIVVKAKSKEDINNKILKVKIEEADNIELVGSLIDN